MVIILRKHTGNSKPFLVDKQEVEIPGNVFSFLFFIFYNIVEIVLHWILTCFDGNLYSITRMIITALY